MIDLTKVYEIWNVLNDKDIDKMEDEFGNVIYEAFKLLPMSGIPPLTLPKCKGVDLVDYKIYGDSVQDGTPTPETPVEIESVGDKTKNLFNISKLSFVNSDIIYGYIDREDIVIQTTSDYTSNGYIQTEQTLSELADLEVGKTYILNFNRNKESSSSTHNRFIYLCGAGVVWSIGKTKTITQEMLDGKLYFYGHRPSSGEETGTRIISDFQIEEGTTTTEWEHYGYKIPVKVSGKNLLPFKDGINFTVKDINYRTKDGNLYVNGTSIGESSPSDSLFVNNFSFELKAGTYTMYQLSGSNIVIFLRKIEDKTTLANLTNNILSQTFTLEEDTIVNLGFYTYQMSFENTKIPIMLVRGNEKTEYESYKEPTITNIFLDEPLRKIGDYTDYIDFEKGKVIRNVGKYIIDGNTAWVEVLQSTGSDDKIYAYSTILDKLAPNDKATHNSFSNKFANVSNMAVSYYFEQDSITVQHESYGKLRLHLLKSRLESISNASLKKWFADNNADVYYRLVTPNDTEIIELPTIPTHKGTTIIEVDTTISPSNMEVQYYGKGV